jgi:type VI protein secretion system component Hcp
VGTKSSDIKIPFLRMVFQTVRITKVSLSLSNDDLPSETITLDYDRVRMEYLWTDNETGERVGDRPCRAGWDREKSQAWAGE